MIPYIELHELSLGIISIPVFGVCVATAILVAREIILHQASENELDESLTARLCLTMLVCGFIGAHLTRTGMPNLPMVVKDPTFLLKTSNGIAALGGFGGGFIGSILFFRFTGCSFKTSLKMLDTVAYSLPFSWMIGRLGCALTHDHVGFSSSSPLAVRFPTGPRFDLGVLEFFALAALSVGFWIIGRIPRSPGFYLRAFGVSYGSLRILLDTLHEQPLRFYGGIGMVVVGLGSWITMGWRTRLQGTASYDTSGQAIAP